MLEKKDDFSMSHALPLKLFLSKIYIEITENWYSLNTLWLMLINVNQTRQNSLQSIINFPKQDLELPVIRHTILWINCKYQKNSPRIQI